MNRKVNPKIIFFFRLYSGFVGSLQNGTWSPSGTPAIYKLLESLPYKETDITIILLCPREFRSMLSDVPDKVKLEGFSIPLHVKRYPKVFDLLPDRLNNILVQLYWALYTFVIGLKIKPDLIYTDRGNILGGAFVNRFLGIKTVIRMLGMPAEMAQLLKSSKITARLYRWAYKSKFAAVIGTRDGSLIKPFLKHALNPNVPTHVRVNGVDPVKVSIHRSVPPKPIIGFVGRLSRGKGAEKLIKAASFIEGQDFEIRIVGYGPDADSLKQLVCDLGLEDKIMFTGRLQHHDVIKELAHWDIYVSLNSFGQISNANLEACQAGLCLALAATEDADDEDAQAFFESETIYWIQQGSDPKSLAGSLTELLSSPNVMKFYKNRSIEFANRLEGWHKRINWEIDYIKSLCDE